MRTYHGKIVELWNSELKSLKIINNLRLLVEGDVGKPFKVKNGSEVYRLKTPADYTLYLKRYRAQSIFNSFKSLIRFRWPFTTAFAEFRMAEMLRQSGFDAMEPVAWAEARYCGIFPIVSAILVKEVPGLPLDQVFVDESIRSIRPYLLFQLGVLYASLHLAGYLRTPRLSDLICRDLEFARGGLLKVTIIDLDLKGHAACFKVFHESFCSPAIGHALYKFLRGRYTIDNAYEIRCFLRGYRSVLNQKGYDRNILRLREIFQTTNKRLATHAADPILSSCVTGMPKELNEILK